MIQSPPTGQPTSPTSPTNLSGQPWQEESLAQGLEESVRENLLKGTPSPETKRGSRPWNSRGFPLHSYNPIIMVQWKKTAIINNYTYIWKVVYCTIRRDPFLTSMIMGGSVKGEIPSLEPTSFRGYFEPQSHGSLEFDDDFSGSTR